MMSCICRSIATRPIGSPAELPPSLKPLSAMRWPAELTAELYRCRDCGALYRIVCPRPTEYYCIDKVSAKLADLLERDPSLATLIDHVEQAPLGLDPIAGDIADRLAPLRPHELPVALDRLLERIATGSGAPAVNGGWVRLFGAWAVRRVEAAQPPLHKITQIARLSRRELLDRVTDALDQAAATPPEAPTGEADGGRAALRIEKITPLFTALTTALTALPVGPPRAWARIELLWRLHRLLALCYAPISRGLVWMPDDQWRLFHDTVGRDGRVRRSIERLAELLDRPELDLAAAREHLVLLQRLFGPEAPATADQLRVLERLAGVLDGLPVTLPFSDPVADARYDCRQLLQRGRGNGPMGDVLWP